MSYGQYMAMYHPVTEAPADKPAKREDGEKKVCQFCRKEFTAFHNRDRKYCSMECKEHADGKSRRERKRAKTIPKPIAKTCLMCGKEFVAASYRNKYCGQFCASRAQAERSLVYFRRKKVRDKEMEDDANAKTVGKQFGSA